MIIPVILILILIIIPLLVLGLIFLGMNHLGSVGCPELRGLPWSSHHDNLWLPPSPHERGDSQDNLGSPETRSGFPKRALPRHEGSGSFRGIPKTRSSVLFLTGEADTLFFRFRKRAVVLTHPGGAWQCQKTFVVVITEEGGLGTG